LAVYFFVVFLSRAPLIERFFLPSLSTWGAVPLTLPLLLLVFPTAPPSFFRSQLSFSGSRAPLEEEFFTMPWSPLNLPPFPFFFLFLSPKLARVFFYQFFRHLAPFPFSGLYFVSSISSCNLRRFSSFRSRAHRTFFFRAESNTFWPRPFRGVSLSRTRKVHSGHGHLPPRHGPSFSDMHFSPIFLVHYRPWDPFLGRSTSSSLWHPFPIPAFPVTMSSIGPPEIFLRGNFLTHISGMNGLRKTKW